MLESEIAQEIVEYLKKLHFKVLRHHIGGIHRMIGKKKVVTKNPLAGFPDFQILHPRKPGFTFFIETKSDKGKLSDKQKEWRRILVAYGFDYVEARSVKDVVEYLESIGDWPPPRQAR